MQFIISIIVTKSVIFKLTVILCLFCSSIKRDKTHLRRFLETINPLPYEKEALDRGFFSTG